MRSIKLYVCTLVTWMFRLSRSVKKAFDMERRGGKAKHQRGRHCTQIALVVGALILPVVAVGTPRRPREHAIVVSLQP